MHNRERATKLLHSVGLVGATQEDIARTAIALDEAEGRGQRYSIFIDQTWAKKRHVAVDATFWV